MKILPSLFLLVAFCILGFFMGERYQSALWEKKAATYIEQNNLVISELEITKKNLAVTLNRLNQIKNSSGENKVLPGQERRHSGNYVVTENQFGDAQIRELEPGVSYQQSIGGNFGAGSGLLPGPSSSQNYLKVKYFDDPKKEDIKMKNGTIIKSARVSQVTLEGILFSDEDDGIHYAKFLEMAPEERDVFIQRPGREH